MKHKGGRRYKVEITMKPKQKNKVDD